MSKVVSDGDEAIEALSHAELQTFFHEPDFKAFLKAFVQTSNRLYGDIDFSSSGHDICMNQTDCPEEIVQGMWSLRGDNSTKLLHIFAEWHIERPTQESQINCEILA